MSRIIEENVANPELNVAFLAETMGMSRSSLFNKIPFVKKDYDSTRIYRNTHKKRVRHRLMTHPLLLIMNLISIND